MHVSSNDYIKKYEPLWGAWCVESFIGEGSYGKVYKIFKEEWGFKYQSALKLISIPTQEQHREAVATIGNDNYSLEQYFESAVKNIVNEIHMMYTLRGNTNIVSYEDHLVQKSSERFGWDILIRMEYLTTLNKYISQNGLTRAGVVNIALDICSALEICEQKNIIHRDIKDENIFVTSDGKFKLGDFGIAKELTRASLASSIRGTPLYMAPEVYRGKPYDLRSDLYSLGIVIYKLLNHGRFPFMPPYPQELKYKDSEAALDKRLSGEAVTPPLQAGEKLSQFILKMCAYDPDERYSSAVEAKKVLFSILSEMSNEERSYLVITPSAIDNAAKDTEPKADSPSQQVDITPQVNSENKDDKNMDDDCMDTVLLNISSPPDDVPKKPLDRTVSIFGSLLKREMVYNHIGNQSGNILNGGLVCTQGSWLYFSNAGSDYNIYKVKFDGSDLQRVNVDESWFLNVCGNWLYYTDPNNNDNIFRIDLEGNGKTQLNDDRSWDITVSGDWIYYINESDGYKLYKIKTDGTDKTKLNNDFTHGLSIKDDWLYYSNKSDGGKIYKINTMGKGRTRIVNDEASYINISGEYIFYCNKSDGFKLYRVSIDGRSKNKLNDDISYNINVLNGWVYYCNKSDGGSIYRIRIEGSDKSKLNNENSEFINLANEHIYYCSKSNGSKLYSMSLGGSNRTKISIDRQENNDEDNDEGWFYL
ncbi:serine/threonine protein kinase [Clostridium sp. Bc-iso-3]|nr:serine/threonine protein kinase [Clostridium sp. Bc-iso-3]